MLRPGQIVALCALALLVVGVVMVNSAGMSVEPVDTVPVGEAAPVVEARSVGDELRAIVLSRPTVYMGLAIVAMAVTATLPVRRLAAWGRGVHERTGGGGDWVVLGVGVAVMIAAVMATYIPGLGREVNGSARWVGVPVPGVGEVSIQPSELAKWGLVVLLAWYGACRAATMPTFRRGLLPGLLALGVVSAAVTHEDLGTGVLIAMAGGIVLLAAGARVLHFAMFIPPAIGLLIVAIITSPYRVERILTFLDPYADPQGSGYHMIQSMLAVAGGEGFGRGLGHGLQKFGYLPEDRTDFLFAVLCEELGIAGAAAVVALYAGMLWAGLMVIRRESDGMLKLAALGVLSTVGLQALINLAVVTGLGPTKGIALPLVSAGGTGWILTAASLGLVVAIDRAQHRANAASGRLPSLADSPFGSSPLGVGGDEDDGDEPVADAPGSVVAA